MGDTFNLERFLSSQETIYHRVVKELAMGQKVTHWMWFIFPQIHGLGRSATAKKYAIHSENEAKAYLEHPVLGARLRECTQLVLNTEGYTASQIFGYPDDLKFRSSMTLFNYVANNDDIFEKALAKYYDGEPDRSTLDILNAN